METRPDRLSLYDVSFSTPHTKEHDKCVLYTMSSHEHVAILKSFAESYAEVYILMHKASDPRYKIMTILHTVVPEGNKLSLYQFI